MTPKNQDQPAPVAAPEAKGGSAATIGSALLWECRCGLSGHSYPRDDTTPANAVKTLLDGCQTCDTYGEDSYRYVDSAGNVIGENVRCRMCGWCGTLDQADEAGTDCPACPACGAEATKLGSPAIAPNEGPGADGAQLQGCDRDTASRHTCPVCHGSGNLFRTASGHLSNYCHACKGEGYTPNVQAEPREGGRH